MIKLLLSAVRLFAVLTVITGVIYPLTITLFGQVVFPTQANGSLMVENDTVRGSSLIGQGTTDPRYFWSRPSAVNYMLGSSAQALGSSGASNLSPASATLAETVAEREQAFREAHHLADDVAVPLEMLFASGSGLDPHISPEAARLQIDRVANTRGLDRQIVADLVEAHIETPQIGILGQARVNVLALNIALDTLDR
ncbi:MAG: K(+)-transporting ATPase subunit C [Anaerolineae bacterium]|nr:K(+)-transporting ATPase subunit C [Anaerolineae bacterium]